MLYTCHDWPFEDPFPLMVGLGPLRPYDVSRMYTYDIVELTTGTYGDFSGQPHLFRLTLLFLNYICRP